MPPILLAQFHITYAPVPSGPTAKRETVHKLTPGGETPRLQPVAVEIFAMCSDKVAAALDAATPGTLHLTLQDWRSGANRRTVVKISPFTGART